MEIKGLSFRSILSAATIVAIMFGFLMLFPQSSHAADKVKIKIKKSNIGTFYYNTGQSNFQQSYTTPSYGYSQPSGYGGYQPNYYSQPVTHYYQATPSQNQYQYQYMGGGGWNGNQNQYQNQVMYGGRGSQNQSQEQYQYVNYGPTPYYNGNGSYWGY